MSYLRVLPQVLPFASEETLTQLEQNIQRCGAMTDMLHEGCSPREITERLLQGLGVSDGGFSLRPRYPATDMATASFGYVGTLLIAYSRLGHPRQRLPAALGAPAALTWQTPIWSMPSSASWNVWCDSSRLTVALSRTLLGSLVGQQMLSLPGRLL